MLKCGLPDKGGKADMVMLYMDFRVNPLIGKLFLKRKNRKIDVRRAERFFPEKTARDIARFPGLIWKIWAVNERCAGFIKYWKTHPALPGHRLICLRIRDLNRDSWKIFLITIKGLRLWIS